MNALLEAKDVGKRFGGVQALADVSFSIRRGEIYGLIGPNGAGKTTLFNVLTGIYRPDKGSFEFDGRPLAGLAPHQVAARGIGPSELPARYEAGAPPGPGGRAKRSACAPRC